MKFQGLSTKNYAMCNGGHNGRVKFEKDKH